MKMGTLGGKELNLMKNWFGSLSNREITFTFTIIWTIIWKMDLDYFMENITSDILNMKGGKTSDWNIGPFNNEVNPI